MPIDLDERVIAVGRVAYQMIGPNKAAEPALVGGTGRHALGFVDEQSREVPRSPQQSAQSIQQFFVGEPLAALKNDFLGRIEQLRWNDRLKCAVSPDLHVGRVDHTLLLKLERNMVIDVVADVLLIAQHLVHRTARPWATEIALHAAIIQCLRNL